MGSEREQIQVTDLGPPLLLFNLKLVTRIQTSTYYVFMCPTSRVPSSHLITNIRRRGEEKVLGILLST